MNLARVRIEKEAVKIAGELGDVVFIGALAVNSYTEFRATKDIDLVVAGPLDRKRLLDLGYIPRQSSETSWYTPRGVKADFYTRDVSKISVDWILKNRARRMVGGKELGVICLEASGGQAAGFR